MSSKPTIIIVTCDAWPALFASDQTFRAALEAKGASVIVAPWQAADFWQTAGDADAIVVRAAWDYPLHVDRFHGWLECAGQSQTPVMNAPTLMRWNADKRYVLDLARRGVPTPATILIGQPSQAEEAFTELGADVAVIKPCHGASGRGVEKVNRASALAYLETNGGQGRSFLLQEMLPEIAAGELSFVFIGGRFAHAVRKIPAPGEFRVNSAFGPASNQLAVVSPGLVEQAASILARLPSIPTYARIDCIERGNQLICLEAEVIEPSLFMHLHPPTADRLAAAVLGAAQD